MEKPVYLTNTGKTMMLNALSGQTIAFTNFAVGNGVIENPTEADIKAMTALVSPVIPDISITSGTEQNAYVRLKGQFSSQDEFTTFGWSELGIYACGQGNQSFTGDGTTATFAITNTTYMVYYIELTESGSTSVVPEEDYTFDTATNSVVFDTAPASGSTIKVYFPDMTDKKLFAYGYDENAKEVRHTDESSVAQVYEIEEVFSIDDGAQIVIKLDTTNSYATQEDFEAHVNDHNNPHMVTAEQIGLTGDAGTDVVNNMNPSFTISSTLSKITSGETLSTLLGKIGKAINYLIDTVKTHVENKNNPHEVSFTQIGGILPVSKGGTGVNTEAALRALIQSYGGGNIEVFRYTGNSTEISAYQYRNVLSFSSTPRFVFGFVPSHREFFASYSSQITLDFVHDMYMLTSTVTYYPYSPASSAAALCKLVGNTLQVSNQPYQPQEGLNWQGKDYYVIYSY